MSFDAETGLISKLLETGDISTVNDSQINMSFFSGDNRTAFEYIYNTVMNTGAVPTVRAFQKEFPRYKLETFKNKVGTEENMKFWCLEVRKKHKHNYLADSMEKVVDKLQNYDSEGAYNLIKKSIAYVESEITETTDVDITKDTHLRKEAYLKKKQNKGMQGIPTGFNKLDLITKGLKASTLTTVIANTGIGKAVTLSTPILTPDGFVPMRDIKVGSIVYDEKGTESVVSAVYPQGFKKVYRVTFEDGTHVDCCSEHLWKFKTIDDITRSNDWRVDTLSNILSKHPIKRGRAFNLSIPVSEPIIMKEADLPVDPYVLGCLLGDGGFTTDRISFTNTEQDIIHKVNSRVTGGQFILNRSTQCQYLFKSDDHKENKLYTKIKSLGLKDCYSLTKFIPKVYLYASIEQRLELLQGLIDTDGHVNHKGHVSYFTSSKQMVSDISELIRSLGYRCSSSSYDREGKDNIEYVVRIWSDKDVFFTSEKHTKKYSDRVTGRRINHYDILKIVDIREMGFKEPMQCITVDSPYHTFICGDYIVTHNTWLEIIIGSYLSLHGYRVLQGVTEMSEDIMRDRYEAVLFSMCYDVDFNYNAFKSGNLSPKIEQQFFDFLEEDLPNIEPVYIVTANGVMGLSADIEKYEPDIIMVDSAYLMEDDQGAKDDWLRVAHITRDLKKLAKRVKKPIMINTQADKNTSKKTGPELGSIMFTQAIGQDCLPENTMILTDCGYKAIQRLENEVFKVFDGENYKKARCVFAGDKEVTTITYRGNEFSCSPNHKLYVYDEEVSNFVWKKAKDIEPLNDYLLEQNFVTTEGCEHLLHLDISKGRKEMKVPIEASYELGMLIGMFIGDGSFKPLDKGQVTISCGQDKEYAEYCLQLVHKYFNIEGEVRTIKSSTSGNDELVATWYCVKLAYWFAFFCADETFEKTTKLGFCELNSEFRRGVLSGLIQSDGSCKSQVEIVSANYEVIRGANILFKSLGICTRYDFQSNNHKGKHRLRVMSYDLSKLNSSLVGYKKIEFEKLVDTEICGRLSKPKSYIQRMCEKAKYLIADKNSSLFKSVSLGSKNGEISQKYLEEISAQPYKFMQVEDVVTIDTKTKMWDIQVFDDDKRIITNGIVTHNSDDVWALFRDEVMINDKEMALKILKQREGSLGKLTLNWNFDTMDFSEIYSDVSTGFDEEDDDSVKSSKDNTLDVL